MFLQSEIWCLVVNAVHVDADFLTNGLCKYCRCESWLLMAKDASFLQCQLLAQIASSHQVYAMSRQNKIVCNQSSASNAEFAVSLVCNRNFVTFFFPPLGQGIARQLCGIVGLEQLESFISGVYRKFSSFPFCLSVVDSAIAKLASVLLRKRACCICL